MTNEQLVYLYQNGEKEVLQEILKQNKGFIYKVAQKFFIGRDNAIDQEDLIQEGYIGLMKAADKYLIDSGADFISYAYYWIYQSIHRFMYPTRAKRTNKNVYITSINSTVPGADAEVEIADTLADENIYPGITESIANKEDYHTIEQLLMNNSNVDDRVLQIVRLRYGFYDGRCYTLEEIANSLNIAYQRVTQIQQTAFREIRKSKWARARIQEDRIIQKERNYDIGKVTQSFFNRLDAEIKELLNQVI